MRITLLTLPLLVLGACGKGSSDDSTATPAGATSSGSTTALEFTFADDPPEAYARIDRVGMPAVSTATITSKDAYNQANPSDDANGDFVAEIVANLTAIHGALDDDLTGLGLVPCAVDDCVAQAAPLVVPDTLKLDLTQPAGFPNGRLLTDPVIDVTLAVVLLDLTRPGQDPTALIGVNPTANDVPFPGVYPWLAPPSN